jgi:hypothetical protein
MSSIDPYNLALGSKTVFDTIIQVLKATVSESLPDLPAMRGRSLKNAANMDDLPNFEFAV